MLTFQKQYRANVHFTFDAGGHFADFSARLLTNLNKPNLEAKILRRAMAEVILPVIREAYVAGLPKAVNMRKVEDNGEGKWIVKSTPRQHPSEEGQTLSSLYERMRTAVARGDAEELRKAQEALVSHQDGFASALQRTTRGVVKKSHALSSGLFRKRALQVMDLLANPTHLGTVESGGTVTVGIGSLDKLNQIETPSATQYKLGLGHTRSKDNILWRHLEFGTGIHANNDAGYPNRKQSSGKFGISMSGGLWYYGRSLSKARLILEGSDGVHAIYGNKQLIAAQRQFPLVVAQYLQRVFSGEPI